MALNTQFTDVMLDLETTGISPDHTAIMQIAAVKFNYETEEVSGEWFDRCLFIPKNRYWDGSTRAWWDQNLKVLQSIYQRMEPAEVVMKAFFEWLQPVPDNGIGWRLWAKPSHFEYPFIDSYFKQFGYNNPFHFRQVRDMNSYMSGLMGKPDHTGFDKEVTLVGDVHNALHDVLHQIKVLFYAKKKAQQKAEPANGTLVVEGAGQA